MDEQKWLQEVSEKIKKKMLPVVKRNVGKIPYNTVDGVYNDFSGDRVGCGPTVFGEVSSGNCITLQGWRFTKQRQKLWKISWMQC